MSLLLNSDIGNRWSSMSHFVGAKAPSPVCLSLKKSGKIRSSKTGFAMNSPTKSLKKKFFAGAKTGFRSWGFEFLP